MMIDKGVDAMKQQDNIQQALIRQIDYVFASMQEVIQENSQNPAKIDLKIKEIWDEFYEGLIYFLAKKRTLSATARKEYIQSSEQYFLACREAYNCHPKHHYRIQLHPKTQFIDPPPRQILSTEERLQHGRQHVYIRQLLQQYWSETPGYTLDQLWGNFYLSLIYYSGCNDLMQLLTIANTLLREIQSGQTAQCWKLYRSDYKTIINPLVLHYRLPHRSYGNQIEEKVIYQWRHVWLNPYMQVFIQTISQYQVDLTQPQKIEDILSAIQLSLKHLPAQTPVNELCKSLGKLQHLPPQKLKQMGTLAAFEHVHFALELDPKLSLDMCLSEVLQNKLKTVSLSDQDQKTAWLNASNTRLVSSNTSNLAIHSLNMEQLKMEVSTAHQQLKAVPFELLLFERSDEKKSKTKRQRKAETITWLRWKKIQKKLQQQKNNAVGTEKNLIEAQLRLLAWVFHLKETRLKTNSIERYLVSIAKDYLFHIFLYEHDIELMTAEDYESLYQQLLDGLDERDEAQRTVQQKKSQQRAVYAYGRLKTFHQFCMHAYAVPAVNTFRFNSFQRIQLCHAKWISPALFHQLIAQLKIQMQQCTTVQEQEMLYQLQLMYLLAYRLGLRLNEVRGLTFNELICPELLWKEHPTGSSVQIYISLRNNVYRRLKSQNAKRQLDLNAVLLPDEMDAFCQYLVSFLPTLKHKDKHTPQLVFASQGEVMSEYSIHQMTQQLFDRILGENHGYSFHNFRHSAANHLAIAWLGSKEMVMTYTDYGWKQAKHMREKLFGESAMQQQMLIQHKWRLLADWMGHASIEQTASHYLHALDLLAIDRIYRTSCRVNTQFLSHIVGGQCAEQVDLDRYIQTSRYFKLYHHAFALKKISRDSTLFYRPAQVEVSTLICIHQYVQHYQKSNDLWIQRAVWLSAKWISPKFAKELWHKQYSREDLIEDSHLIEFYNEVIKRGFDEHLLIPIHTLQKEHRSSVLLSLKILVLHATLRKNYLYFSYSLNHEHQPEIPSFIDDLKIGMQHLRPMHIVLEDDHAIDINKKTRQIKLRFVHNKTHKNVTRPMMFALLLLAIQQDRLWK